ncbi:NAD(P)H-hydrate epimerase [Ceratocystis platani]|uniref:NAD(P)H-hydrate epimerase n=1 Tax=Ceratocystis fimbriata f. sp. platani TaxID=88771 RepID=A0A0F8B4A8_CERFI|nr:NAD(P)H-hydrate epimerase [Ceratocystis platani]
MTLKTLGAKAAAALDAELMSSGAFSIDQLMELAGLAAVTGSSLHAICTYLSIPFSNDFSDALGSVDHVVDAIFGFSFSGPVREPFRSVISQLASTSVPVTSIDAPSSWDIHSGPPPAGNLGCDFHPATLVSLTAPKPLVRMFKGRHFIGGRFVGREVAERYGFEVPPYQGLEQVVEIDEAGRRVEN